MVARNARTPLVGGWTRGSMQIVDASVTTGDVFFVDSGDANALDNAGNGASPDRPFATLDFAIGQCAANNGDNIYVAPGHAETLIADSGVDIDIAGVSVIGIGNGEDRPIFTFTTDVAADFKIAAANVRVSGLVFKCNIASQAMMIEVTGDDAEIDHCEFREGSATGLNFITIGVADNDADRCYVHDNLFYMPTAGNGDSAINFAKDHAGVAIEDNYCYGDFNIACVDVPAAGNAQVNLRIRRNSLTNLLAGQHCIQVNSTTSTGVCEDNRLVTDVVSTSLDPGGLASSGNLWNVIGDADTEGVPPNTVSNQSTTSAGGTNDTTTDTLHGKLGTDTELADRSIFDQLVGDGPTAYPAAAAPANDVSLAEVARENYDQAEKVFTIAAAILATGTNTIFTVAGGPIEIISLLSVCVTANDGTASTLQWTVDPTDGAATTICGASASLANAAAGTIVNINGVLATAAVVTVAGTAIAQGHGGTGGSVVAPVGAIQTIIGVGSSTGTWTHHLRYKPLGRGVVIT